MDVVSRLSLLLVDEVHLLGEKRGATLEVVVSRMKNLSRKLGQGKELRIIAISATVPNIRDISYW